MKRDSIAAIVCALLLVPFSFCACSSNEQQAESASSSSSASSGRIALNENTSDVPVPLEKVSVTVYNATVEGDERQPIEGLAEHGAERLQEIGIEEVAVKSAAMRGPFVSYIVYRSPRYEQAAWDVAEQLGIKGPIHETGEKSASSYSYDGDIAVILCEDWALSEGLVDELPEQVQQAIDQHDADFSDGVR